MDQAESLATTKYEEAARRLLALLMVKPAARQEYNAVFSDLEVEEVFPKSLRELVLWTLGADYPITYPMARQKSEVDLLQEFSSLGALDRTASGIGAHIESFLQLYQVMAMSRMGIQADPTQPPQQYIERLLEQLTALGQRRVQLKEARGSVRLAELRQNLSLDSALGYRRFGLYPLDQKLPGLNYTHGDMGIIAGLRKIGKTRFVMNLVIRALELYPELNCTWISTEPFSSPESIMLSIWAMLAARAAYNVGVKWDIADTAIGAVTDSLFMKYIEQGAAEAEELGKRLFIYGPGLEDGNAAQLTSAMGILQCNLAVLGHKLVVVDNFQQFVLPGVRVNTNTDYELMLAVTRAISTLGAQHKVVLLGLSQLSRAGELKGGGGMDDRAAWALRPSWVKGQKDVIKLKCEFARKAPSDWEITLGQLPFSGWLTGD